MPYPVGTREENDAVLETNIFSLQRHVGEYHTWPQRSRLLREGTPLPVTLPGYDLLRQYETVDGYLFVTDYDCPFEEKINFILVGKGCKRILSERGLGAMYASYYLNDLSWQDERHFTAIISGLPFKYTIRKYSIPYLYPKLWAEWPRSKQSHE
jgi:hypothetical protein